MTSSIKPKNFKSSGVIFRAFVAVSTFEASLHKIAAHPSGDITLKTLYLIMASLSATPIAKAPPLPPSPITIDMVMASIWESSRRFLAIASDCPLSSAPSPGYAPGVSISIKIGRLNFSASFAARRAFL